MRETRTSHLALGSLLLAVASSLVLASVSEAVPPLRPAQAGTHPADYGAAGAKVGLGKVLTTSDGGQIFGWDLNESGSDGLLTDSQDVADGYQVSVETFDQGTGTITGSFQQHTGPRITFGTDGIFAGDVGLVTRYIVPNGTIYAKRRYVLLDPVTEQRFTAPWSSPVQDFDVLQHGDNQATSTGVLYGIELKQQDDPGLVVTDFTAGGTRFFDLDPTTFALNTGLQLAQDTQTGEAVFALSPDGGAVGGSAPVNVLVNLKNGHTTSFTGLNGGPYGSGFVNGLGVDSATGIACTTTELNAQVEFYDLGTHMGHAVQLPGTQAGDQLNSGAFVTNDSVHGLFLVADPDYAPTGGSAIVVYDESGNVVESITGFSFSNRFSVVPLRIAVNPSTRTGWVDGPGIDQLQQFHY